MDKTAHHCLVLIEQAVKQANRHPFLTAHRSKIRIKTWDKVHRKLMLKENKHAGT